MSRHIRFIGALLPGLVVLQALAQIQGEDLGKIREAAPASASVAPKHHRLMLVFSRSEGFKHSAIPYAAQALEILGKKTGAFETVQSDDLSMLLPENLERFDAICFNNTTQLKLEDPRIRKSLLEFIAGGKGIVGIHAATDNFPTWIEGQELLGGVFDSHPWTAEGTWAVRISDPSHPVNAGFGGKDFLLRDEIYRIRQLDLRKHARVLLALDMRSARNQGAPGVRTSDKDIPISWVRVYGKGRLFYSSLGHNEDVYWNSAVLKHYLDGIQFALGDLPVDTTPVPFDPMSAFDRQRLGGILQSVAAYRHGQSRAAFAELNALIRWMGDVPEGRLAIEQGCLGVLRGSATPAGKEFICEKLRQIGSDASVGVLAGMLADTGTAAMALYALEGIPGSAVDSVLLQALRGGHGGSGTVTALGHRRVAGGVKPLASLVTGEKGGMALAAVSALGEIGTPEALSELERLAGTPSIAAVNGLHVPILHALVICAEKVPGAPESVLPLYRTLLGSGNPAPVRRAAFRGIVLGDRDTAGALIHRTLVSGDTAFHAVAARLLPELRISSARSIAADLHRMPPATQVQVLTGLESVRDPSVQDAVINAMNNRNVSVRIAAIRTLGVIGNGGAVAPLARAASLAKGDEQKEARGSLAAVSGPAVAESLQELLQSGPGPVKVEVLKAMAERGQGAMPLILAAAKNASVPVRIEAARTLRVLAGAEEIPALVDLLVNTRDQAFRREMEFALAAAARKSTPPEDGALLAAYPSAKRKEGRLSLIGVMGKIGSARSLPFLREILTSKDADLRREAIRALSGWPTGEPVGEPTAKPFADLWAIARTSTDNTDRTLALRGSVRLVKLDSGRPPEETIGIYREAMRIAPNLAERRLLLSALGENPSLAAIQTAAGYLSDQGLRTEAEAAMLSIAQNLPDTVRRMAAPEIRNLIAASRDTNTVKRAKAILTALEESEDYISAWESSGPYGESGEPLLDRPYAPELPAGARWSPLAAGPDPANAAANAAANAWQLELDRLFPGEEFVVYLRASVWSPAEVRGRVELRNTHPAKVWWNGAAVLSTPNMRNFYSNPETAPVEVRSGWNNLMVKLEQGESPWRAALRLRDADGGRIEGIRASATPK